MAREHDIDDSGLIELGVASEETKGSVLPSRDQHGGNISVGLTDE